MEPTSNECEHLVTLAEEKLKNSYAPHSQFHVVCAGELEDGTLFSGTNQENASYPSGLCAERVALFYINHQFPERRVKKILVAATSNRYEVPKLLVPCGACLQVMMESETRQNSEITIYLYNPETKDLKRAQGVSQFLPFHFKLREK